MAGQLLIKSLASLRSCYLVGMLALMSSLAVIASPTDANAQSSSIKTSESVKHYRISGKTAAEFAVSMSKKGPYSRQHRRRAWATATRDMTYQLYHRKGKQSCRIQAVKVRLKVTYEMPKLASRRGISKRQLSKWKKMFALLNKHERTHGLYYRQFAKKVYSALRKLKRAKSCSALEKSAARIVAKLGKADKKRNVAFDNRDNRNYRNMERIYSGA